MPMNGNMALDCDIVFIDLLYHTNDSAKCFRESHILTLLSKKASKQDVRRLMAYVLLHKKYRQAKNPKTLTLSALPTKLPQSYCKFINIFSQILKRTKPAMIRSKINIFCSYEVDGNESLKQLLTKHVSSLKIFLCLKSIIKEIMGKEFFGTATNWMNFCVTLRKFCNSRKFDRFQPIDFMRGVDVKKIQWLKGKHELRRDILRRIISWLMDEVVCVVLRGFFYITDKDKTKNKLFFYRKPIWRLLTKKKIESMTSSGEWRPLKDDEVGICRGYSVRFLPKENNLRPLLRLPKSSRRNNAPLCDKYLLCLLSSICQKEKRLLGAAGFGLTDIHTKCRKYFTSTNHDKPIYFVKTDIANCFASIKLHKLQVILKSVFKKHKENGMLSCKIDWKETFFRAREVFETLQIGILNNCIKIDSKTCFAKSRGVMQGWSLSVMLCNIYYGALENEHFCDFMEPTGRRNLFVRVLDDTLFATEDKDLAVSFLRTCLKGFPEFGFHIRLDKTATNFSLDDSGIENYSEITVVAPSESFLWFGHTFTYGQTNRHGIGVDMSRYIGSVRDCMSVNSLMSTSDPYAIEKAIIRKIKFRFHGICYDTKISSLYQILRNIYEISCLVALQWFALRVWRTLSSGSININLIKFMVKEGIYYNIKKHMKGRVIPEEQITWISLKAFSKRLSVSANMKRLIRDEMRKLESEINEHKRLLKLATATYPQHLKKIKIT